MEDEVSAAARVFGTSELCEIILLFAEPADVLRCRRVAGVFLDAIAQSRPLQRKLFLAADEQCERTVNPLAPSFFHQQRNGYRDSTIAARIDLVDLWEKSLAVDGPPLWHKMLISQPPTTTCVIPVGSSVTIYHRRVYPDGMTFGDLERAVIAAFEIKKGRRSSPERLEALSKTNTVLIYWR